jgi:hypothetical protein
MHLLLSLKRTFAKTGATCKACSYFLKNFSFFACKSESEPKRDTYVFLFIFGGLLLVLLFPHTKMYKGHFLYPIVVAQTRDPTP